MKRGRKKNEENQNGEGQPKSITGQIESPKHLDRIERAIFERVANVLQDMHILTIGDVDLVASYAQVAALGMKHKQLLDNEGATFSTEKGYIALHPNYLIWRDCYKSGQKILNDLGLTPASRTRVAAIVQDEIDDLTEFLKNRNKPKETDAEEDRPDID